MTPEKVSSDKHGMFAVKCSNTQCESAFTHWSNSRDCVVSEWNTRADGWISVDDHHIKWSCVVAIPLANGDFYINMVSVGDEGDLFDMDGSYIGYHASQVTHWMPLPNPPTTK